MRAANLVRRNLPATTITSYLPDMNPAVLEDVVRNTPSTRWGNIQGRVVHTVGEAYRLRVSAEIDLDGDLGDRVVGSLLSDNSRGGSPTLGTEWNSWECGLDDGVARLVGDD